MRYIIRSCYVENTHEETISPELFHLIKRCRRVLTAALEIEEIFDNLVSNYLEIESKCFAMTARSLVRRMVEPPRESWRPFGLSQTSTVVA